jgi:hypothetical protein
VEKLSHAHALLVASHKSTLQELEVLKEEKNRLANQNFGLEQRVMREHEMLETEKLHLTKIEMGLEIGSERTFNSTPSSDSLCGMGLRKSSAASVSDAMNDIRRMSISSARSGATSPLPATQKSPSLISQSLNYSPTARLAVPLPLPPNLRL